MRIVCEQCQTKYIVPDEKIVKSVLRLTCQKCGHVITTRVNEASPASGSTTSEAPSNTLNKWRSSAAQPAARRTQGETPIWYYSYNGESFGPYTEQELTQKLLSDKVLPVVEHCFIWRKSFSEWKPALQVEPFASAIQAPPPPPAPATPKKVANPNMPPLLDDDDDHATQQMQVPMFNLFAETSSTQAKTNKPTSSSSLPKPSLGKSSPDVPSLKQRLQSSSNTSNPKPRFDLSQTKLKDQIEEEDVGDTTRVGAPSPLLSFQSLDAISPDIKSESKTGNVKDLAKPFPSLSGIAPISKTQSTAQTSIARPGFGGSTAAGINPLLANKGASNAAPKIPSMRSTSAPLLNSDAAAAKMLQTTSAVTQKSPIPAVATSTKATALEEMPDFKEDIGSIVSAQTPMSLLQASVSNADVKDWSDGSSASRIEGISLPDLSLSSSSEHEVRTSDIDLESVSLDDNDLPNPEDLPEIDIDDDSSQIFNKENINLDKILNSSNEIDAISLDSDSSVLPATKDADEDDEPKLLSSAQMLSMVHRSTASNKSISRDADVSSADLADINLDDEDSQFIPSNIIDDAVNGPNSGIVGDTDDLFGDQPEEKSVARVRASHNKLEEISSKYEDLFNLPDPEPQHSEDGISENSMMIQLAHFNKVQEKEKRKRNTSLIAAIIVAAVIVVLLSISGVVIASNSDEDANTKKATFGKVEGRTVSSDELNELAPLEDFEIVVADVPAQKPARARTPKADNAKPKAGGTKTAEPAAENTGDVDTAANETAQADTQAAAANADVLDALYGADQAAPKAEEPAKPKAIPANKKDGRANIVLQSAGDFASTEAVKGSKYSGGAAAASKRDIFAAGIRSVSQTVQECHKREAKTGNMMIPKIYIKLTVDPSGVVNNFDVEEKSVPDSFVKCLEAKKDRWKFAPFEGSAVQMRQGFVLD